MNISKKIDAYLLEENKKRREEHKPLEENGFYISQAGYSPRVVYFQKTLPNKTHPARTLRIFLLGNIFEEFLAKCINLDTQTRIKFDHAGMAFSGRTDFMDETTIYELKTIKELPTKPLLQHAMQLNLYLYGYNLLHGELLEGKLIYFEKSSGKIKEFPFHFNHTLFEESMNTFKAVYSAIQNNFLPHCSISWYCNTCLYQKECGLYTIKKTVKTY